MRVESSSSAYDPPLRAENVLKFYGGGRRVLSSPQLPAHDSVVAQLNKLVKLPEGWDGYRAPPVRFDNAYFAVQVIQWICTPLSPAPQIVPGPKGDLQLEWHLVGGDVELHIRGPNDVLAWRHVPGLEPIEQELNLTNDFTEIATWVGDLTEPPGANNVAAA